MKQIILEEKIMSKTHDIIKKKGSFLTRYDSPQ